MTDQKTKIKMSQNLDQTNVKYFGGKFLDLILFDLFQNYSNE